MPVSADCVRDHIEYSAWASRRLVDAAANLSPAIQREWPLVHDGWRALAHGMTDESLLTVLDYQDLKGNPWRQSLWQIVLHVVNHGTHHRGQVSGFLRSMGHTPPPLDLIAYYRGL